jgi:probable phosphoglycerate mutase
MRLLLARHGETVFNVSGRIQGQQDSPLTPRGEAQARLLAARLAGERIDVAYASDSGRTMRTAEIALAGKGLTAIPDAAWRETSYGEWEGLSRQEIAERYPGAWEQRSRDRLLVPPPGGEPLGAVRQRAIAAAQQLRQRHAGQTVLVISHGGTLYLLGNWLMTRDPLDPNTAVANCSLSCIHWHGDSPEVEFWADAAHLGDELAG